MKYRVLGRTGLRVSEIGFGGWAISGKGYGRTLDAESLEAVHAAFANGVNFFDTADVYGNGHGEELLGEALSGVAGEVFIATKVGWDFYHGAVRRNFEPGYIEFACDRSLARLKRDVIDLYQLHNPGLEEIKRGDIFQTLKKLKSRGKIRFYGVSIHEAEEGVEAIRFGDADSVQAVYNMMDQRMASDFFPLAKENNIGLVIREPLACGILAGKYDRTVRFEGPDHRRRWKREKIEADMKKLELIRNVLGEKSASLSVLALAFILNEAAVSTVIPGMKSVSQVLENILATDSGNVSSADIERLQALFRQEPVFREGLFRN